MPVPLVTIAMAMYKPNLLWLKDKLDGLLNRLTRTKSVDLADLNLYAYPQVGILTTPFCIYVAELFKIALSEIGIKSKIETKYKLWYEDIPYIVISPQWFRRLPQLYVAF